MRSSTLSSSSNLQRAEEILESEIAQDESIIKPPRPTIKVPRKEWKKTQNIFPPYIGMSQLASPYKGTGKTMDYYESPHSGSNYSKRKSKKKQRSYATISARRSPMRIPKIGQNVSRVNRSRVSATTRRTARSQRREIACERSSGRRIYSTASPMKLNCEYVKSKLSLSTKQEHKTKRWLRRLYFDTSLGLEKEEMLLNPFRNGILLFELMTHLEPNIQIYGINYTPKTVKDCEENLSKVL